MATELVCTSNSFSTTGQINNQLKGLLACLAAACLPDHKGFLFLQVLTNTVERKTSARKEKLFGLMTRVNGRGRLIPTPAPDKKGCTEAAGGLGGPLLKTIHCIVICKIQ